MTDKISIALEVMALFKEHLCDTYLVGGSIRNLLLNIPIKDIDLATDCLPQDIQLIAESNNLRYIPTGIEHGTSTIIYKGIPIEITTFRIDKTCYGRKADVQFVCTIQLDLSRRDFAMNAIAMNLYGHIIDPFNGKEDLKNRLIKAVGDPDQRFEEDQLRALRAIRFATVLDFYIETNTFNSIKKVKLTKVSNERIRDELSKILESPNRARGLSLLDKSNLLIQILPEVSNLKGVLQDERYHPEKDTFIHTTLAIQSLPPNASLELVLATLLHDIGKPATRTIEKKTNIKYNAADKNTNITDKHNDIEIHFYDHESVGAEIAERVLQRLKFTSDTIDEVKWLIANHMRIHEFPNMRKSKQIRLVQEPYFNNLLELLRADIMGSSAITGIGTNFDILQYIYDFIIENEDQIKRTQVLITKERLITGFDIIEMGINPKKQGKLIGKILESVEDDILEGNIKTREGALEKALELVSREI